VHQPLLIHLCARQVCLIEDAQRRPFSDTILFGMQIILFLADIHRTLIPEMGIGRLFAPLTTAAPPVRRCNQQNTLDPI
jgi:hypothetical protein